MSKNSDPCKDNNDCIQTEACLMGFCIDPCQLREACASNANCQVKMHRPICTCPKNMLGNPAINCTTLDLSKKIIQKARNDTL